MLSIQSKRIIQNRVNLISFNRSLFWDLQHEFDAIQSPEPKAVRIISASPFSSDLVWVSRDGLFW